MPVASRAAVGEELDWLCLGITNIPAAHIPVVGTLSRPPSVAKVNAPVCAKPLLAEFSDYFIFICFAVK